ncbi:MAG: cation:proton antiporter [Bacilli bacterium]|jgi:Kef-type K+ transport system membrane component KefB|nr:cation:proton antiporter [Bacilli bacterium]
MTVVFNTLLYLAIFMVLGLLSSRVMKLIHFPNVTGYLLTGIIFGPYVLGAIVDACTGQTNLLGLSTFFGDAVSGTSNALLPVGNISWLSNVALGFIAFTIGQSFKRSALKSTGKRIIITTCCESLGGAIFVLIGLLIPYMIWPDRFPLPIILTLASIACATAPAATILVVKQYKAHGPVVDTLLPVVALDDAVALICYAILFSIAKALVGSGIDIYSILVLPIMEIVLSLALGTLVGILISVASKFFRSRGNRMIFAIAGILLCTGLSNIQIFPSSMPHFSSFAFSPLLCCMMIGAIFCNVVRDADKTIDNIDRFTPPFFMLFFIISGAELNIGIYYQDMNLLAMFLPIAIIYFIMRGTGKWVGAYVGCSSDKKADPKIKKYLGFMLLPQAGVAIGLATTSGQQLSGSFGSYSYGEIVVCVILSTTIVYNIIGAFITKTALIASGEVDGMGPNRPRPVIQAPGGTISTDAKGSLPTTGDSTPKDDGEKPNVGQ